jgi:serine protease Do
LALNVQIGELPPEEEVKTSASDKSETKADNRLGIVVKDLTDAQRDKFGLEAEGILVDRVDEGAGSKSGLRQGDVILQIDNEKVKDTAQFKELVGKLVPGKSVPMLVHRRGNPTFLAIKIPEDAKVK